MLRSDFFDRKLDLTISFLSLGFSSRAPRQRLVRTGGSVVMDMNSCCADHGDWRKTMAALTHVHIVLLDNGARAHGRLVSSEGGPLRISPNLTILA